MLNTKKNWIYAACDAYNARRSKLETFQAGQGLASFLDQATAVAALLSLLLLHEQLKSHVPRQRQTSVSAH